MGHGTSIPRELPCVSINLQGGCTKLSKDMNLRLAFVCFVKSGEWLDELAVLVPHEPLVFDGILPGQSSKARSLLADYQMTKEKMREVETLISSASLKSTIRSFSLPVTPGPVFVRRRNLESYFNMDESSCFNGDEYLAVLLHILFPLYLASPQYQRYLKRGIEHGRAQHDEDDGSVSCLTTEIGGAPSQVPSAQSKRLQDILLGCAAYFDESLIEKRLSKPEWVGDVANALDNHTLGISVVDMHLCREQIVYSNSAFHALSEFTASQLRRVNLNILHGPETEIFQLLLLREAMHPMKTAKFAITYYTKSKRAFTDLVAVKTTAHYSVMVHFPAVKGANVDDLKDVDDLLILVCQLFEPPPAHPNGAAAQPSASWLPAPLSNIINSLPSPRFLHSPRFQFSSSSSGGGSGGEGSVDGRVRDYGSGCGSTSGGTSGGQGGGASSGLSGTPTSAGHSTKHNPSPRSARSRGDSVRSSFSARSAAYRLEANAEGTEELGAAEHI